MIDEVARGQAAERLLADDTINMAWKAVIDDMMAKWAKTPEDRAEERESLYRNVVAVGRVRGILSAYVMDGKMAAERAERELSRA